MRSRSAGQLEALGSPDPEELRHALGLSPGRVPTGGGQGVVPTALIGSTIARSIHLRYPSATDEPLDRPVERARPHVDAAARSLADVQFDGMAVLGPVKEGEQDSELGWGDREKWLFRHGRRYTNIERRCYVTRY